ncbi:MAG: hypothetical protein VKI81_10050 [Synechococcaceae cyanobacterium]|nr:hypothetical protein [Synechococcaceae cyanobacterium]
MPASLLRHLVAAALPALAAGPLWAAPDPALFPPEETFRRLRLITLICGRDNTAEACDEARAAADPLLDHPRLPASCKDALWTITQKAHRDPAISAAQQNGKYFARRDPIDEAAQEVLTFCRQQPARTAEKERPEGQRGRGSFGLIGPQGP